MSEATIWSHTVEALTRSIDHSPVHLPIGKVTKANGLVIEAVGIKLPVGSGCRIEIQNPYENDEVTFAEAEVVGFEGEAVFLMPLHHISGLIPGAKVYPLKESSKDSSRLFPLGDGLLGRVLDASGNPLDNHGKLRNISMKPLSTPPINPLDREPITEQIDVGVRAINGLLSVGKGQRMGLFAGSGVGKSVTLGMMSKFTTADIIVVGLIGERGREVQEFLDHILTEEERTRAVVVAAPADNTPLERLQGAAYTTRIAEHFRDEGRDVLLIMDSLTRYAMAQREIALAVGEPPATKGYPPSVFAKLPGLVERAGNGKPGGGSITAFYTVLTEGDDQQDPIADSARAILDGHIVLSRRLSEAGHYPAIDIEASISRVMSSVTSTEQQRMARELKKMYSRYQRNADMLALGAYVPGQDMQLDAAIAKYPSIEAYLQQTTDEASPLADSVRDLHILING